MNRRSALVLGVLVASLSLTSCATFTSNNDVATVGGVSLDRSTFELYLREALDANDPLGDNSQTSGDTARGAISSWIGEELIRQQLAEQGIPITEADRATAEAQLDAFLAEQQATVSDATREFIIDGAAARAVFEATQEQGSLGELLSRTDVTVDSRYGYFDQASGAVLPFG